MKPNLPSYASREFQRTLVLPSAGAYPLLLSDLTLRQQTNFAEPTGRLAQAPLNQFSHAREFTPADWKVVVRPNVDTLYSPATLDLGPEPIVLSVPATDRYLSCR